MTKAGNSQITRTITLLITIFSLSLPAYAQYGGGTGEPNDPYLIYTAEQMIAISQNVEDWDKHFRLTADLDLTGIDMANYTSIGGYQIVGDDYIKTPFQGVFDGNDHSITGFTYRGENYVGLFGVVDGDAHIKGLKLIDPNVGGARKVGVLVGRVYQATVTRCRVQGGKVNSIYEDPKTYLSETIGGLIGQNVAGIVTDCHTTCDVPSGRTKIGGLIGENQGTIQDCSATGTIGLVQSTKASNLGGLVGKNTGSISGCFATGSVSGNGNIGGLVGSNTNESDQQLTGVISACYATGSVSGTEISVGGLVGYNAGTISGCYAAGQVNGKEEVGGLAGSNGHPNSRGEIADCYATGSVTGQSAVGGLVGANPGTVSNCYATGPVSGGVDVGGCIGRNSYYLPGKADGTVIACFWNHDTSGQLYSDGGFGKSTNQMQDPNTYLDAGWDLVGETVNGTEDIWWIFEGQDYPRLRWQYGRAFFPHPQDGAIDVIQPLLLNWTPGGSDLSHDVYFDEDAEAVANATTESLVTYRGRQAPEITSYDPGTLRLGKTYYWRIDEVNEADPNNTWKGSVWSFTTTDFIVVDDFEDYDAGDNRIWYAWQDGLGYGVVGTEPYFAGNGTGATVGDETTNSFTEEAIVHGGRKSLPYIYDNNKDGLLKYSEATKTLTKARDWTEQGVRTLSLWFRGFPPFLGSFTEAPADTFILSGEGADIEGSSDQFHFAWQELTGAGTIIAKVESIEDTDPWAKAGLMIRDTLDADSAHGMVAVTPSNGVWFGRRIEAGGGTYCDTQADLTTPVFLKLERTLDGHVRAYYSTDGSSWTQLGLFIVINMNNPMYVGLAVTSHNPGVACKAVISNVTSDGTDPWTNQDIGLSSNEAEPMYLTIANNNGTSATVNHENPNATLISTWTEWYIGLKDFSDQGVDLTDVNSITIGFGDPQNPQPGGSGRMYFDDIRLYPPWTEPE